MKKILLFISLFFTSIIIANAELCVHISGDGTHIGDEIACGTEHFYVISNDGENIRMMAKYNLYVGRVYDKIIFEQTFEDISEAEQYYEDNYADKYFKRLSFVTNDEGNFIGVLAFYFIEEENILQNEIAIGAHGGKTGEPEFPEIGIVKSPRIIGFDSSTIDKLNDMMIYDFELDEISVSEESISTYLALYEESLTNLSIEYQNIDILSLTELNEIIYHISGENIPLEEWYEDASYKKNESWGDNYYVLGSIKNLLPTEYEWIFSTTYWLRSISVNKSDISQYFVDTLGDLCLADYCAASIGAGIRPIVTIKADDVIYKIDTVTDGHGTVKADYIEAKEGTVVRFTVEPMEGYVLGEVKVTDANGKVVVFKDYTFTMPDANVLIEAKFIKIDNPNTMTYISIIVVVGLMISGTIFYKTKKKLN